MSIVSPVVEKKPKFQEELFSPQELGEKVKPINNRRTKPTQIRQTARSSQQKTLEDALDKVSVRVNIRNINLRNKVVVALRQHRNSIEIANEKDDQENVIEVCEATGKLTEKSSAKRLVMGRLGSKDIVTALLSRAEGYMAYDSDDIVIDGTILQDKLVNLGAGKGYSVFDDIADPMEALEIFGYPLELDSCPLKNLEHRLLEHAANGLDNVAIGERENMALSTIKNKFTQIYKKIGAESRAHAVAICLHNGWIT